MMNKRHFRISSKFFCTVIYILLFAIMISSCQTVIDTKVVTDDVIFKDTLLENATFLILKNGANISLEDKELYHKSKYTDSINVLLIKDTEGFRVRDTIKNETRIKYKETIIPLLDVKEIHFDKKVYNSELTIIAIIAASVTVIAILAYYIDKGLSGLDPKH